MFSRMRSAGSILDALGGTGKVASALSIDDSTVSGWRTRGIPAGRWPALVRLAAEQGCNGITFELLAELPAPEPAEARA